MSVGRHHDQPRDDGFKQRLEKNLREQKPILDLMQTNDAHHDQPRCVWLSEEDFINKSAGQIARIAKERFDAAPSDPVEVVRNAMDELSTWADDDAIRDAVLGVLGWRGDNTP